MYLNTIFLVFLETKKGVDHLTDFLNARNYNTVSIHGDKSQDRRQVKQFFYSIDGDQ